MKPTCATHEEMGPGARNSAPKVSCLGAHRASSRSRPAPQREQEGSTGVYDR